MTGLTYKSETEEVAFTSEEGGVGVTFRKPHQEPVLIWGSP